MQAINRTGAGIHSFGMGYPIDVLFLATTGSERGDRVEFVASAEPGDPTEPAVRNRGPS